ncbi:gp53-like domain-containing protein, partial [Escherichia coli]|uniref:gp53-like domain-containing protein n=1 Tax=Escherichia coli TaxID=562 RepID=UPI00203EC110
MHRIDTKTAQKDKFGAGKNGFTRGNPQTGTPATDLDDDYFDMLQEELCSVVEASGASLEKGRHDQLLTALRALLLSRKNPFGDIKSDGTVQTALENLGLGDIALAGVSSGALENNGYAYMPLIIGGARSSLVIQWGSATTSMSGTTHTFPVAFPNSVFVILGADASVSSMEYISTTALSNSQFS